MFELGIVAPVSPTARDGAASVRVSTYSGGASGQWKYLTPLTPVS